MTQHRNHPFISVRRLIVFNYEYGLTLSPSKTKKAEDLPILRPLRDDSESLIICPSEGGNSEVSPVKNGKTSNSSVSGPISVVESKLKAMLGNIALKVFDSLQKEMISCDDARSAGTFPQWLLAATRRVRPKANDEPNSITPGAGAGAAAGVASAQPNAVVPNTKKLQAGRLRKFMGDLCMQVCSPVDALAHYAAAIADSRQCSDSLWLAGSLEGYAAAVLTLLGSKPSAGVIHTEQYSRVITVDLCGGTRGHLSSCLLCDIDCYFLSPSFHNRRVTISILLLECL